MSKLSDIADTLASAQVAVQSLSVANEKAAQKQLDERNAALKSAEEAGLSVDAGSLPPLSYTEAQPRFATLAALLVDAQSQIEAIESHTA